MRILLLYFEQFTEALFFFLIFFFIASYFLLCFAYWTIECALYYISSRSSFSIYSGAFSWYFVVTRLISVNVLTEMSALKRTRHTAGDEYIQNKNDTKRVERCDYSLQILLSLVALNKDRVRAHSFPFKIMQKLACIFRLRSAFFITIFSCFFFVCDTHSTSAKRRCDYVCIILFIDVRVRRAVDS